MKRSDFFAPGPLLADPRHGSEPSLYRIIVHYYTSHDINERDAEKMADDYIAAVVARSKT